jgi:hypothetical protein
MATAVTAATAATGARAWLAHRLGGRRPRLVRIATAGLIVAGIAAAGLLSGS